MGGGEHVHEDKLKEVYFVVVIAFGQVRTKSTSK